MVHPAYIPACSAVKIEWKAAVIKTFFLHIRCQRLGEGSPMFSARMGAPDSGVQVGCRPHVVLRDLGKHFEAAEDDILIWVVLVAPQVQVFTPENILSIH